MAVHWQPKEMPTVSAALPGGRKLIELTNRVFNAEIARIYEGPGGAVMHAEIRFGDSLIMTGDPQGPEQLPPASLSVYVPDVDETYRRALDAGCTSKQEPKTQFYGDRSARVVDMFGNQWNISTHVEDVSEEEMNRRMQAMMKSG